jgi:nitronate monooxygenase
MNARFEALRAQLSVPVIAAPMFLVSNPVHALAACAGGVVGSFSTHSARTPDDLRRWFERMRDGLAELRRGGAPAPYAVNLVVHATNPRLAPDLELCCEFEVPIVLTSKGAPREVVGRVHAYGGLVLHDVASRRHAEIALEAGADGLIAVCGGAGGHCGTLNPFALMGELRELAPDVPIVLAGAIHSGRDVLAAQVMGADLCYVGTRFLATVEAGASDAYKAMAVEASATDVLTTDALDGSPTSVLIPSLRSAGIDPAELRHRRPGEKISAQEGVKRWRDLWSAGHSVGRVRDVPAVGDLVARLVEEYARATGDLTKRVLRDVR